ncbi:hypothetical protein GCM10023232_26940 [Sphingosinicella ginsenosidimutans]
MVALPQIGDPTLALADKALEQAENSTPHRPYLGMSAIGGPCDRALWYGFRWASPKRFDAATLKRFADGHQTEAVAIARLKACDQLEVYDLSPDTGRQFGFEDHHGHFRGHMDGVILGLLQAPKTWHVLEIKAVSDAKFRELEKAVEKVGEKLALREWSETYYAQAVLYMDYADLDRHYCVVCTPGCRRWMAVRTERDKPEAGRLRGRAQTIIASDSPPPRISEAPDYYQCRWCDHAPVCHQGEQALSHCRTCLHSTPVEGGEWHCARWARKISVEEQREGCPAHLYIPGLVPGEQVDAGPDWVEYRLPDGSVWRDGGAAYTIGDTIEAEAYRHAA